MSKEELGRKDYEEALEAMQGELTAMAGWASQCGARILVILEGRDTAGKTGAIHAISQKLNPRQVRTVALPAPTDREKTQWYFQRYVPHLPAAGEIVLFDRSWYNRAGVEKVMGFATDEQVEAFLEAAPKFEKLLVEDGLLLFKYWLTCDQEEQEERLAERHEDPAKQWKISSIDVAAIEIVSAELAAYDHGLMDKPRWIVLTKIDCLPEEDRLALHALVTQKYPEYPCFLISALTHQGTQDLCQKLAQQLCP